MRRNTVDARPPESGVQKASTRKANTQKDEKKEQKVFIFFFRSCSWISWTTPKSFSFDVSYFCVCFHKKGRSERETCTDLIFGGEREKVLSCCCASSRRCSYLIRDCECEEEDDREREGERSVTTYGFGVCGDRHEKKGG